MSKLLIICGPTATRKTDLGIYLAKKFNGEIISADSRQVYRGMDIITGKDLPKSSKFKVQSSKLRIKNKKLSIGYRLKNGIPIWLVDIVDPDYPFNVGEYAKLAYKVIENIRSRGKLPIIVGGTGLYIKSIIKPLPLIHIPPDAQLRIKIDKLNRAELAKILQEINPEKWSQMHPSDRLNPRRLIRAIEITYYLQTHNLSMNRYIDKNVDTFIIGLTANLDTIYNRIDKRVENRIKKGATAELKTLLKKFPWNSISFSSTGYREIKNYIDNKMSIEEASNKWKLAEHAYAKRQLTWFKKALSLSNSKWFDITNPDYQSKIEDTVKRWYTQL